MEMLKSLPLDPAKQQEYITSIRNEDGYNWGYNPFLWGVPKGSYATNSDGPCRVIEFRKMVQALNRIGLRIVVDVVYNHLPGNGPVDDNSVLDKIVSGCIAWWVSIWSSSSTGFSYSIIFATNANPNGYDLGIEANAARVLDLSKDHIQVGMAANLKDYLLTNCDGQEVKGSEISTYGGAPVAYASQQMETINYVSAHDNETLFDIVSLKTPMELSVDERCMINHLAASIIVLSQPVDNALVLMVFSYPVLLMAFSLIWALLVLFYQTKLYPYIFGLQLLNGPSNGSFCVNVPRSLEGCYYVFEVTIYHPSTLQIEKCFANAPSVRGLSGDGKRAFLVDLDFDALKPHKWDNLVDEKPDIEDFSDISINELHIRDFRCVDTLLSRKTEKKKT